jgi:hypothetical protein
MIRILVQLACTATCLMMLNYTLSTKVSASVDFTEKGANLLQEQPQKIELAAGAGKKGEVRIAVATETGEEYFFSAEVHSNDRVVFFLGGLSMSYHQQGKWQQVCGLVRSNGGGLELKIDLRALGDGAPAEAVIRNLVLQKVTRPQKISKRPKEGRTLLVDSGKPTAIIVYPKKSGDTLANELQQRIREKTSVSLPVLSDVEVTETEAPKIKAEYRHRNLILIGQLGTNRALWSAYNRFLAAEDGYYPGGNGFVLRTAAGVLEKGVNHLILGGSSNEGVKRAVEAFSGKVASQEVDSAGRFYMPWLLEVDLQGDCNLAFQEDQAIWSDPAHPLLPALTSGYGKVVRWYRNAMAYYWSADPRYLERSNAYLQDILSERADTHHYIVEFLIRTYDMLDDSPMFSSKQVHEMDSLILQNFLDFLTKTDLNWMGVFSPPYEALVITNRHQIAPWYADLLMARFLSEKLDLSGDLKALAHFRRSEKEALFDSIVAQRIGPSLPGIAGAADYEEFPAMFFRYALENERYDVFFRSGLAHQTLGLERLDHITGRLADPPCPIDLPIWLGAMAQFFDNGSYQWLADRIRYTGLERGPFQGRYVAGVHRYQSPRALTPDEPPKTWAGVKVAPQPLLQDQTEAKNNEQFPLISMRGGFKKTDDLLQVAGWHRFLPAGSVINLVMDGVHLLNQSVEGGEISRSTTNGASVVRIGRYPVGGKENEEKNRSRLRWHGEFRQGWGFGITTKISSDMEWARDVIRIANGEYLFCDTFTATREGHYLLQVGWQPRHPLISEENRWLMKHKEGAIRFQLIGDGVSVRSRGDGTLAGETIRKMKRGESVSLWTVIQRENHPAGQWHPEMAGQRTLQLSRRNGQPALIFHQGVRTEEVDADLVITDDREALALGWNRDGVKQCGILPKPLAIATQDNADAATTSLATTPKMAFQSSLTRWVPSWTYDGLRRPALHPAVALPYGVYDLGEVLTLDEVRSAVARGGAWKPSYLPEKIFAAPEASSELPPPESELWLPIEGTRQSRPGCKTGNYGETMPVAHADESFFPKGKITTRFLRVEGMAPGTLLKFFIREQQQSRHPLRLTDLSTIPGVNKGLIMVAPGIFPQFTRPIRDEDFSLTLLSPVTGRAEAELDIGGTVQSLLVADQQGNGEAELYVLKADAMIETYALNGQKRSPIDLYQQFLDFQKAHGRDNTRAPAGGHYMPFSMGLWRADSSNARKWVIGRYGSLAFLDSNRKLEGIINFPSYASPGMLSRGVDFDRDGKDEMLTLEMYRMIHTGGEAKGRVRDREGSHFWPQTYNLLATQSPDHSQTELISGAPIHAFDVLEKLAGRPRYVLVVRSNYAGVYDAVARKWSVSWRPSAPVSAARLLSESDQKMEFCFSTTDGLFWNASFDSRRPERFTVTSVPLSLTIHGIHSINLPQGPLILLSCDEGLFLTDAGGNSEKIATGAFRSGLFRDAQQIIAVDEQGTVSAFHCKP